MEEKRRMNILDWIGYVFGYVIYFGYKISGVYVVGLLLFTIVLKFVMLPSSLKQQRTSAKQARLQPKLKELQEMYKSNPQKMQQEQQALYARENISPMSGCLPMLIQFPVLIGLYQAVVNPLTLVLHLPLEKVSKAMEMVTLPENTYYAQSEFIKQFASVRDKIVSANIFTNGELAELDSMAGGAFNLFGMNLLDTPNVASWLVLIPIICFVSSIAMSLYTMKTSGNAAGQTGCTKWGMPIGMSAFSTWLAFSVPGAVGLYWVLQNLTSIVQSFLMHKYYNAEIMAAMEEAARYARRENEEAAVLSKFGGVDIHETVEALKQRNDAALEEKASKADSIYESIDAKNVVEIKPIGSNNEKVIKTGNATRAGTAQAKKKKKK